MARGPGCTRTPYYRSWVQSTYLHLMEPGGGKLNWLLAGKGTGCETAGQDWLAVGLFGASAEALLTPSPVRSIRHTGT